VTWVRTFHGTRGASTSTIRPGEAPGIDHATVQSLGQQLWKWAVAINGVILRGQSATKSEAIAHRIVQRSRWGGVSVTGFRGALQITSTILMASDFFPTGRAISHRPSR
jgi:hypothetical protein